MSAVTQAGASVRLEWGACAVAQLGAEVDRVVVVDEARQHASPIREFSPMVQAAFAHPVEARIHPAQFQRWQDESAVFIDRI